MIINFKNFLEIIKNNFFSIIFVSIFISLSLSYFFFNISKSTVSKVYIKVPNEFEGYKNLIDASNFSKNMSITHKVNRQLLKKYFLKINNFQQYKNQEFSKMMNSIFAQLNSSIIIKKNNKAKKFLAENLIVFEQLLFSKKVENEIKKIININLENYINTLNSELSTARLVDMIKNFKKNHEDYINNFEIFENNTEELFNYRSFCLVRCYIIKTNFTENQIYLNYQYEIENKEKIEIEYLNLEKKLESLSKILNNLDSYRYENHYTINQSRAAPMILFHEFFLFLFLISISLVSIFVLFKKSFDEEN